MNYLLDTHTLLWAITEPKKLSLPVQHILKDAENEIFVSTICFWEISLKYSLQKLTLKNLLPEQLPSLTQQIGFKTLQVTAEESATYHHLQSKYHKDPFDRMLIWQAIHRKLILISKDENVGRYTAEGLKVIW
jgi:PIN domain nuclease of toxin-antitoxin system